MRLMSTGWTSGQLLSTTRDKMQIRSCRFFLPAREVSVFSIRGDRNLTDEQMSGYIEQLFWKRAAILWRKSFGSLRRIHGDREILGKTAGEEFISTMRVPWRGPDESKMSELETSPNGARLGFSHLKRES